MVSIIIDVMQVDRVPRGLYTLKHLQIVVPDTLKTDDASVHVDLRLVDEFSNHLTLKFIIKCFYANEYLLPAQYNKFIINFSIWKQLILYNTCLIGSEFKG